MINIEKPKKRGGLAISQVIILIIGIVAIAYIAGSQIRVVSAATDFCAGKTSPSTSVKVSSGGNPYFCYYDKNQNIIEYDIFTSTYITSSEGWTYTKSSPSDTYWTYTSPTGDSGLVNQTTEGAAWNKWVSLTSPSSISSALSQVSNPSASSPSTPSSGSSSTDNWGTGKLWPTIGGAATNVGEKVGLNLLKKLKIQTSPSATVAPSKFVQFLQSFKGIGETLTQIATYAGVAITTYAILNWVISKIPGLNENSAGDAWLHLGAAAVAGVAGGGAVIGLQSLGFTGGLLGGLSVGWLLGGGAAIAVIAFMIMYKQHTQKAVVFTCIPWQAPVGSDNCNKCGENGLPCTAYQCASLGQNCELLNKGVNGKQLCTAVNTEDTVAPVMGFIDMEPNVYSYQPLGASVPSESNSGVAVSYIGNSGNFPPYTDLQFGISTKKPARCGISPEMIPIKDSTGADTFSQLVPMDAGIFEYNHSFTFNTGDTGTLPTVNGKMNFYIRCQNTNGINDSAYFVVQFGVDKTIVHTLPVIETADLLNNSPITSGVTSTDITVYVNKPVSGCKWSPTDRNYQDMENTMSCSSGNVILNGAYAGYYPCSATLKGLTDSDSSSANNFYFRCNDTLGDVNNAASVFMIHLKGTQPLVMQSASPNNTIIEGISDSVLVNLKVQTFAGADGQGSSICSYNDTVGSNHWTPFENTGSYQSSQQLLLPGGNQTPIYYTFPIICVDNGSNAAYATIKFGVLTDTIPPSVVRAYKSNSNLVIATDKNSTCVYDTTDCTYLFKDGIPMTDQSGTLHETSWMTGRTYYIKCQDTLGVGPEPSNVCTAIIQPSSL